MASNSNSLEKFWQELKRRKVVHVITVYAAVAFVILQLVDIVAEPLRLPIPTKALVIVLLCIGFIISIFVSWIYDITPSGVKKTKPISAVKRNDIAPQSVSRGWKVATYFGALIIVALMACNFISKRNLNTSLTKLEKSIAVLPFINDSPSDSTTYFDNGIMDDILANLQKIKAFSKVLPRTSVEQYRGSVKPTIPKIAKDLDVNFIVSGSGQKYGSYYRVRVQLIAGKTNKLLWGDSYEREIKEPKDIFIIQSKIAQSIAEELKATITPEEKQRIEKTPTASLTALDFYQRGQEEFWKYASSGDTKALERAEGKYKKAIEYDSGFAQAYIGLSQVYLKKNSTKEYFSRNFMDSVLILSNKALSYDDHLAEAYLARADYYVANYKTEQAIKEFDSALRYNPNYWEAYHQEAMNVFGYDTKYGDYVKAIEYLQKAISLNHGKELPGLLRDLGDLFYNQAGFPEKGNYYYQEAFKLDGDSISYYYNLASLATDLNKIIELFNKCYSIDSSPTNFHWAFIIAWEYMDLGDCKKSLEYFKKYTKGLEASGQLPLNRAHRIGYAYWKNGYKNEAEHWFSEQKRYCEESINKGRNYSVIAGSAYYDLAGVYAVLGEKKKALENLKLFALAPVCSFEMQYIFKTDWLFDNVRNELEFQQIARNIEAKYQAEHERVKKWLEETGQL